jgi:hypothetical protein
MADLLTPKAPINQVELYTTGQTVVAEINVLVGAPNPTS